MSSIRRTRTIRTARSVLTALAIGTVATLGVAVGTPLDSAFATTSPNSPAARVGHSIESGHLLDDMRSGKLSEDDIVHAASTGFTANGQHVDKVIDLSAKERADMDAKTQDLRAALAADPEFMAAAKDAKAAQQAEQAGITLSTPASPSSSTAGAGILESKHWWNHLIHWWTLHIPNIMVRGFIAGGAGFVAFGVCAVLDLSRVTCALAAAGLAFASEAIRSSGICNGKGISIPIPDTWHTHCMS